MTGRISLYRNPRSHKSEKIRYLHRRTTDKGIGLRIVWCLFVLPSIQTAEYVVYVVSQAEEVRLSRNQLELAYGKTEELTATVLPADCTDAFLWESTDNRIVSVTGEEGKGTLTAVGVGVAASCSLPQRGCFSHM